MGLSNVITDIAPLFQEPSPDVRTDEELYGNSLQVIEDMANGWCYVRTDHGTEGYTYAACLEQSADVAAAWRKYQKHIVLAPYIDVNQYANAASAVVASIPRGGILVALGKPGIDGWQKVGLPSGSVGYTRASYIGETIKDWAMLSEADMRWNLVESALSYNGAAWRTGGRTPLGIDAVGLVTMAYLLNGVEIGREAAPRGRGPVHKITQKEMKDGDILYFRGSMGIFIGDGRFVHATDTIGAEGVLVNSLVPKQPGYRADLAEHIVSIGSLF